MRVCGQDPINRSWLVPFQERFPRLLQNVLGTRMATKNCRLVAFQAYFATNGHHNAAQAYGTQVETRR